MSSQSITLIRRLAVVRESMAQLVNNLEVQF